MVILQVPTADLETRGISKLQLYMADLKTNRANNPYIPSEHKKTTDVSIKFLSEKILNDFPNYTPMTSHVTNHILNVRWKTYFS